jgi:hypothetical protein
MTTMRRAAVAATMMLMVSVAVSAQSQLAVADADKFMGDWELGLETPQGAMTMTLALKDQAGKVAATVTTDAGPIAGTTNITDVSRDTDKLVLKYSINFQGMDIPTEITLIPDGEKWKANFNFASGQFVVDGTAVKK